MHMKLIFDPAKNKENIRQRGISFEVADSFDFRTALIWKDTRMDYGESRWAILVIACMCWCSHHAVTLCVSLAYAKPIRER